MESDHAKAIADLKLQQLHNKMTANQRMRQKESQRQHVLQLAREAQAEQGEMLEKAKADHERAIADVCHQFSSAAAELKSQHSTAVAELKSQHAEAASEWTNAIARLDSDSKQFKYTVRGSSDPLLSGSIPRSILQAEPESVLARMYAGEWEYAKDDIGRAIINSNPKHWPVILDWLSFGTVPSHPSKGLISECEFWQLDKLLAAIATAADMLYSDIDTARPVADSHNLDIKPVIINGHAGFSVNGMIHEFPKQLSAALDSHSPISIQFAAAGRDWHLLFQQEAHQRRTGFRVDLVMDEGTSLTFAQTSWALGSDGTVSRVSTMERPCKARKRLGWPLTASEVESLMHPRMLSVEGSLKIALTITFK